MGYFECEELPEKPQEKSMQNAEKQQLDQQQKQDAVDNPPPKEMLPTDKNTLPSDEHAPNWRPGYQDQPQGDRYNVPLRDSVFYPLVEAVRVSWLKSCKYDLPTPENSASLKEQLKIVEDKYRLYRIGPEVMAGAYFVSPFVAGYALRMKENPPAWMKKKKAEEKTEEKTETPPASAAQAQGKSAQQQAV